MTRKTPKAPLSRPRRQRPAPASEAPEQLIPPHDAAPCNAKTDGAHAYATVTGGPPGKGNPPKHGQFVKGKSGNPLGKKKMSPMPLPGNVHALIGKTFIEKTADYLRTPVKDLQPSPDDLAIDVLALQIVKAALQGNSKSQLLILEYYVDKQRGSARYAELDAGSQEAQSTGDMLRAMLDPTMTDEGMDEVLERIEHSKHQLELLSDSPLFPLPPLPPPAKRRARGRWRTQ